MPGLIHLQAAQHGHIQVPTAYEAEGQGRVERAGTGNGPDRTATGGSTVLTLDNAPADGSQVGVQLTGGPVASRQITVKV